jgi:hypothetical protein
MSNLTKEEATGQFFEKMESRVVDASGLSPATRQKLEKNLRDVRSTLRALDDVLRGRPASMQKVNKVCVTFELEENGKTYPIEFKLEATQGFELLLDLYAQNHYERNEGAFAPTGELTYSLHIEKRIEKVEGQEFTCPTCGSHAFGTGDNIGYCHGSTMAQAQTMGRHETVTPARCTFSWPRSVESDAKVFKGNGVFSPKYQTAQSTR